MRRVKRRYLVVMKLRENISASEILAKSIDAAFGVYGLSRTRPTSIYKRGKYEIVSIVREGLPLARAALSLYSYDEIIVVRVTGTSKRARRIVDSMPEA